MVKRETTIFFLTGEAHDPGGWFLLLFTVGDFWLFWEALEEKLKGLGPEASREAILEAPSNLGSSWGMLRLQKNSLAVSCSFKSSPQGTREPFHSAALGL